MENPGYGVAYGKKGKKKGKAHASTQQAVTLDIPPANPSSSHTSQHEPCPMRTSSSPPPDAPVSDLLSAVMNEAVLTGKFFDTTFYVYSRRTPSAIDTPRAISAHSIFLKGKSDALDRRKYLSFSGAFCKILIIISVLSKAQNDLLVITDASIALNQYDYDSDSDFDEAETIKDTVDDDLEATQASQAIAQSSAGENTAFLSNPEDIADLSCAGSDDLCMVRMRIWSLDLILY